MNQNFDLERPLKKFSLVYMLFQTAGASFWARQEDVRVPQPTKTWLHTFGLLQLTGMLHVHSIFTYDTYCDEKNPQQIIVRHLRMLPESAVITRINSYIQEIQ